MLAMLSDTVNLNLNLLLPTLATQALVAVELLHKKLATNVNVHVHQNTKEIPIENANLNVWSTVTVLVS
jgi:hypothetical protein